MMTSPEDILKGSEHELLHYGWQRWQFKEILDTLEENQQIKNIDANKLEIFGKLTTIWNEFSYGD